MKYISIDIETLGLDPDTCDMIEFGAVIDDFKNPQPFEMCPKIRVFFDQELYTGQMGAMAMHGDLCAEIRNFDGTQGNFKYQTHKIPVSQLGDLFVAWYVGAGIEGTPTVAGKNLGAFDMQWLRKYIKVRHRILDVGPLFFNPKKDKALPNLQECLRRAGIKKSISHTSVDDAWDVIQCIRYYYGEKK